MRIINTYRFFACVIADLIKERHESKMQQTAEKNVTLELASLIYKTAKMGGEAITDVLPKIKDGKRKGDCEKLREELTRQFTCYEKISAEAEAFLGSNDLPAKDESMLVKMASKAGIIMNTMKDPSPSHVAEMTIKGLTMGITDMTSSVREGKEKGCEEKMLTLAEKLISFQEDSIDKLKAFL